MARVFSTSTVAGSTSKSVITVSTPLSMVSRCCHRRVCSALVSSTSTHQRPCVTVTSDCVRRTLVMSMPEAAAASILVVAPGDR
ncbi:hypothetical protein OHR68_39375 [Spirillospora sp. NBC_00431]